MVHLVHLERDRIDHIVDDELEVLVAHPVLDVPLPPREHVVHHDDLVAKQHEQVHEVGAHEAGAARHKHAQLLVVWQVFGLRVFRIRPGEADDARIDPGLAQLLRPRLLHLLQNEVLQALLDVFRQLRAHCTCAALARFGSNGIELQNSPPAVPLRHCVRPQPVTSSRGKVLTSVAPPVSSSRERRSASNLWTSSARRLSVASSASNLSRDSAALPRWLYSSNRHAHTHRRAVAA
eukprot:scaffold7381_cov310-Pinguiococcus_pyrenoidosus.AAC.12